MSICITDAKVYNQFVQKSKINIKEETPNKILCTMINNIRKFLRSEEDNCKTN